MNQQAITTKEGTSISQVRMDTSRLAPQSLGEVVRFAEVMARGDIALPEKLRDNPGACMAVALYALDVGMNPFAVASKAYFIKGALAFEAQFITALINTKAGLARRLDYAYQGSGASLTCTVTGEFKDGSVRTYTSPPVSDIAVKNSPLWKADTEQQLGYYSARAWARRHCPEVIMGIYTPDEMESIGPDNARNITPEKHGYANRLEQAKSQAEDEGKTFSGFDADHVDGEIAAAIDGATGSQTDECATEATEAVTDAPNVHDSTHPTGATERAPTGVVESDASAGAPLLDGLRQGLAACQTEAEVMELSAGYGDQINEADPETKRQAKLLRAERLQQLAEGGAE